jgi:hypothetical protein
MYLRAPPRYSVGGTENYEKLFCTHPLLKMQSLTEEVGNVLDYLIVPFKIQLQNHTKF